MITAIPNADECAKNSAAPRLAFTEYSTTPLFANEAAIKALLSWTTLISAGTIQLSPLYAEWVVDEAPNTMFGTAGANDTALGIPKVINDSVPQAVRGTFQNPDAAVAEALFQLSKGFNQAGECIKLGVFIFDRNENVQTDGATYLPFIVETFSLDQIAQPDNTTSPTRMPFTMYLRSATTGDRWQQNLVKTKLNFNPTSTAIFNN